MLILLSMIFPGAAQFANNQKGKGAVFIAVYVVGLLAFFAQLAVIIAPLHSMVISGVIPDMTPEMNDALIGKAIVMGWIVLAGFVVMIVATIDAVIVGKRAADGGRR